MRFRAMTAATLGALFAALASPSQGIAAPVSDPGIAAPVSADRPFPFSQDRVASPLAITERCVNTRPQSYCIAYAPPSEGFLPCPNGYLCLYSEADFKGHRVRIPSGDYHANFDDIECIDAGCTHGGNGFNDETTSWANNNTGRLYCVTKDAGAQFPNNDMPNNTQGTNIGSDWNDQVSALSFLGC